MTLKVAVLGPLQVSTRDGEPLTRRLGRRERAVLTLLALHRGAVVPAAILIDELWPNEPPDTAANTVQVYVSRLRRALGPEAVRGDPIGYALQVGPDDLDVDAFERLTSRGKRAVAAGRFAEADDVLRRALHLWRGEPLVDGCELPAVRAAAVRLIELYVSALEDRFDAALALGEGPELLAELELACGEHPLRERLQAARITALFHAGRQSEALDVYREHRARCIRELGIEPGPLLQRLQRSILAGGAELTPATWPLGRLLRTAGSAATLPTPRTPLVGRDDHLSELVSRLEEGHTRLLTLTGPGGSGKTRLAIALAHQLQGSRPDGVYFVPLASIRDTEGMWAAIADAMDTPPELCAPSEFLRSLASRSALLVLDNLEQLADAGDIVSQLLDASPHTEVVATSRRVLRVIGEHAHPVPPLAVPPADARERASEAASVVLFAQHAVMANPDFGLSEDNMTDVAALCRRLDGLPLAIEIVAARSRLWSPRGILAHLEELLEVPDPAVDRPPRQQSLRSTVAWSVELLSDRARGVFRRLGVFVGGAGLDAVTAVTDDALAPGELLSALDELVDASLVTVADGYTREPRVGMLETIRSLARDLLRAERELDEADLQHAQHYAAILWAHDLDRYGLTTARRAQGLQVVRAEQDNLQAALERIVSRLDAGAAADDPSMTDLWELAAAVCGLLTRYWHHQGRHEQAIAWNDRLLRLAGSHQSPLVELALTGIAISAWSVGQRDRAWEATRDSVAISRRLADGPRLAFALTGLAYQYLAEGDISTAVGHVEEAVAVARACQDAATIAGVLEWRSIVAEREGDLQRALEFEEEACAVARHHGDEVLTRWTRQARACLLRQLGRLDEANQEMHHTLGQEHTNDRADLIEMVVEYAAVLAELGEYRLAARLFGACEGTIDREHLRPLGCESATESVRAAARTVASDVWSQAYRTGWHEPIETALADARRRAVPPNASAD